MTHALDVTRADSSKPYGNVSYADPGYQADGKKRYPLDSEAHCRAAWSYVNMPKNAAKYTADQLAKIKGRIKSAAKRYGIEISENARPMLGLCTRAFDFELDSPGGDGRTLEGYAAVFNTPARIRDLQGDFDETIAQGAFRRSIAAHMPVLQFDHGKDPRIGGTPIGKIDALSEDSRGLHVRARLFSHPDVERVREAIAEGAVTGMSFRFGVPDKGDVWGRNADGVDTREIRDADIHELGPVVFPAYDQTSVSVRSLLSQLDPGEMRELLHELAGHLSLAVDLQDLTGRPGARSAGGGEPGTGPGVGRVLSPSTRQLLDDGTLRLKGIIK